MSAKTSPAFVSAQIYPDIPSLGVHLVTNDSNIEPAWKGIEFRSDEIELSSIEAYCLLFRKRVWAEDITRSNQKKTA